MGIYEGLRKSFGKLILSNLFSLNHLFHPLSNDTTSQSLRVIVKVWRGGVLCIKNSCSVNVNFHLPTLTSLFSDADVVALLLIGVNTRWAVLCRHVWFVGVGEWVFLFLVRNKSVLTVEMQTQNKGHVALWQIKHGWGWFNKFFNCPPTILYCSFLVSCNVFIMAWYWLLLGLQMILKMSYTFLAHG